MKELDFNLPDLSEHLPEPQVSLGEFEAWVRGDAATRARAAMTEAEVRADFTRNEGRMREFRMHD